MSHWKEVASMYRYEVYNEKDLRIIFSFMRIGQLEAHMFSNSDEKCED